ncbi:MAG: hypothetical protein IIZ65_03555, partial [Clostridia bacterium]|nr:hypothetical protein [Clostridia bacterium]
ASSVSSRFVVKSLRVMCETSSHVFGLLTLYLKVEPMAPFLFLHHYMDATCLLPEKQPKFPKMHFAVAFSGKRIEKSFEKSNPNPPKCILRLLFRKMPGR